MTGRGELHGGWGLPTDSQQHSTLLVAVFVVSTMQLADSQFSLPGFTKNPIMENIYLNPCRFKCQV